MATTIVCPECRSPVPYGHLSCPSCGSLLAAVAGADRRTVRAVDTDGAEEFDEDRPIGGGGQIALEPGHRPDVQPAPSPAPVAVVQPARRAKSVASSAPASDATTGSEISAEGHEMRPAPFAPQGRAVAAAAPAPGRAATHGRTAAPGRAAGQGRAVTPGRGSAQGRGAGVRAAAQERAAPPVLGDWPPEDDRAALSERTDVEPLSLAPASVGAPSSESIAGGYLPPSAVYPGPTGATARPASPFAPPAAAPAVPPSATLAPAPSPIAARPPGAGPMPPQAGSAEPSSGAPAGDLSWARMVAALSTLGVGLPGSLSSWLAIGGSVVVMFSFVLPWATNGVIGSGGTGFTATWGLANPGHLLLILGAAATLVVNVADNRIRVWLKSGVAPLLLGGVLLGLAFAYFARPFGGGSGVTMMLLGAIALVVGGLLGIRPERNEPTQPSV